MSISWATLGDVAGTIAIFIGLPTIITLIFYYSQQHVDVLKAQQEVLKQRYEIEIGELRKQTSEGLIEVLQRRETEIQMLLEDRDSLLESQAQIYENRIKRYEDKIDELQVKLGDIKGRLESYKLWEDRWMGRSWNPDRDT